MTSPTTAALHPCGPGLYSFAGTWGGYHLTRGQVEIILVMGDEFAYKLSQMIEESGIPEAKFRHILKELVSMGLVRYGFLTVPDEMLLAGRGYSLTLAGASVKFEIEKDKEWTDLLD